MQDVEDLEHRWLRVSGVAAEAGANPGEVRPSITAQAHQLTVERHPTLAECIRDCRELRELLGAVASVRVRTETERRS